MLLGMPTGEEIPTWLKSFLSDCEVVPNLEPNPNPRVFVGSVVPGSAAAAKGIEAGHRILGLTGNTGAYRTVRISANVLQGYHHLTTHLNPSYLTPTPGGISRAIHKLRKVYWTPSHRNPNPNPCPQLSVPSHCMFESSLFPTLSPPHNKLAR